MPAPHGIPSFIIDPTDVLALVAMALFSIRRIELRGTEARAFPQVPRSEFDAWFALALRSRSLAVNASFAKFALNNLWFFLFRSHVPGRVLGLVGALLFVGWLAALSYSFFLGARAKRRGDALGIVVGRKLVEGPGPAPDADRPSEKPSEEEASSR